jgi:hypothetical protein
MHEHKCLRCLGKWETVLGEPKRCGVCGSPLWNRAPVRKAGAGRPKGARNRGAGELARPGMEVEDVVGALVAGSVEELVPDGWMLVTEAAERLGVDEERVWERALSNQRVARPRKLGDGRRVIWAAALERKGGER